MTKPSKKDRPPQLIAIALIGIVLGSIGVCVGSCTAVTPLYQGPLREVQHAELERQAEWNPVAHEQLDAQRRLESITDSYLPLTITHQVLNLLASLALLVASILLLRWRPIAPLLFAIAAGANVLIDLAGLAVGLYVQLGTRDAMQEFMADVGGADPMAPVEMGEMMGAMASATIGASVCIGIGLFLVKLVYYALGVVYVRRPGTQALFTEPAPSAPPPVA